MKVERREHPRPQFIRENWESLNGEWQFKFDDANEGVRQSWFTSFGEAQKIQVPFTYETKASGVHQEEHHAVVWYRKTFEREESAPVTLYFEGVDYQTSVWLNGQKLGDHVGAYNRFSFDLSDYLRVGENELVLRVEDHIDSEQTRGKQRWMKDNFGCWYVQTTGIWKSVWLETQLSPHAFDHVKITPDLDAEKVHFAPIVSSSSPQTEMLTFEAEIQFEGLTVNRISGLLTQKMPSFSLDTRIKTDPSWGTRVWSPENPNLYDVIFRLYDEAGVLQDEVFSYFGMRKIAIEKGQILLNNMQLYQRLILDQGYWPESGITPPSIEAMEIDIDRTIEMGYNGLRKHQKIEDERFLYLCDQKGLLVWCEMPSSYTYNDLQVDQFIPQWQAIVKQHYNHPSIITWVPFNESWGIKDVAHDKNQQSYTEAVYHLTKTYDQERPVITNDGWVHTISDILTLHDYEELGEVLAQRYVDKDALVNNDIQFNKEFYAFAEGYHYQGQPIIISEFGGIAFSTSKEDEWGYGNQVKNNEEFMTRFDRIHQAIQDLPYCVGYCYTQLTDVEQEVNGLLDVNREAKVELEAIAKINHRRTK